MKERKGTYLARVSLCSQIVISATESKMEYNTTLHCVPINSTVENDFFDLPR